MYEKMDDGILLCKVLFQIINITRPKPAYGRQGLAGSWVQDTDQAGTFLGVLNHENQPGTLKNYKNRHETMKNKPGILKNIRTDLEPWKTIKTGLEL